MHPRHRATACEKRGGSERVLYTKIRQSIAKIRSERMRGITLWKEESALAVHGTFPAFCPPAPGRLVNDCLIPGAREA